ncbi:GMC oxidoreductase [Streptococcus equi]|uniref:Choline dehydrogenase n=1 Tax=Streptococcus equi subsp. equi TaxID=148942 RepID=A0A380JT53_9STRE|nr:GMC family oxidoreductase [Streptococcus equi]SUN46822.1 choline dehydrogenase [Streptococcus equi subsp. equi]
MNYDFCIIGGGASGAIASNFLSRKGFKVALIERAGKCEAGIELSDDLKNYPEALTNGKKGGYAWTASCLGGGTFFYGGVSLRFRKEDFKVSDYIGKQVLGVDWPISYEDLKKHYTKMEKILKITGQDNSDGLTYINEGNSDIKKIPFSQQLAYSIKKSNEDLIFCKTPLAINYLNAIKSNLSKIDSISSDEGIRHDAYHTFIKPVLNLIDLYDNTRVIKLLEFNNKVTKAVCKDLNTNKDFMIKSKVFILAANGVQSAAILLNSKSKNNPFGIGNNNRLVGKGLSFKASRLVRGEIQNFNKIPCCEQYSTGYCTDYYLHSLFPDNIGGLILEANPWESLKDNNYVQLECLVGDTPLPSNYIELTDDYDKEGFPIVNMVYNKDEKDCHRLNLLSDIAKRFLESAGIQKVRFIETEYEKGSSHIHGTCRMGTSSSNSVVDKNCKVHDIANLYIVDGSVIPYSSGINPTLTIQANALRVVLNLINKYS